MQSGYRLGSIKEFAVYDETIKPERLELLRKGASHYLREPYWRARATNVVRLATE